jgi:hypothetical protein
MAYIGREPAYGLFEVQTLSPNGTATNFSLDFQIAAAASVLVVKNGSVQKPGTDYNIASGGNSLVFTSAPANGASLYLVYLGKQFLVPTVDDGAIGREKLSQTLQRSVNGRWRTITANATLAAGDYVLVDTTSSAIEVTLPATPSLGDTVKLVDGSGTFATNNLTINPNGEKLAGVTGNQVTTQNRSSFELVYFNQANGWVYL